MSVSIQECYRPTQQKGMTQTKIEQILQTIADGFRVWSRSPILHWPEEGLKYEDVSFPSQDGVPLEGWFIPGSIVPGFHRILSRGSHLAVQPATILR